MSPQEEISGWPNFDQVIAETGISRRTLERQVSKGEWATRKRIRQGGGNETVFDPDQVAARVPAPHSSVVRTAPPAAPATVPAMAEAPEVNMSAVAEIAAAICQQLMAVMVPPVPAPQSIFVDLDEAARISGLNKSCLRGLIDTGRIGHVMDTSKSRHKIPKIRRADLETFGLE